jgi:hypothetical protein
MHGLRQKQDRGLAMADELNQEFHGVPKSELLSWYMNEMVNEGLERSDVDHALRIADMILHRLIHKVMSQQGVEGKGRLTNSIPREGKYHYRD